MKIYGGIPMKITMFKFGERRSSAIRGEKTNDLTLIFFGSAVLLRMGSTEKLLGCGCGILLGSGSALHLRPAGGREMRFDSICFTASASELKYIGSLGLTQDMPFHLRDTAMIRSAMELLKTGEVYTDKNKADHFDCVLRLMLISISEQLRLSDTQNAPHYFKLRTIRDEVYRCPAEAPAIDDICSELGISRTYFHRIYYSAFGVTYMHDVINSRMMLAKELLRTTVMSVSMISEECGYESDSYFMQQFKKTVGCTPTQYRRSYNKD